MPIIRPTEPLADLVDESFDEATFLWHRWDTAELGSLTRNLDEVYSWTEDRLHGALDGVRLVGPAIVELSAGRVLGDDLDAITVCAGLLGSSDAPDAIDLLQAALATNEGQRLAAVIRGLEALGSPRVLEMAFATLASRGEGALGALCRLEGFHRTVHADAVTAALKSGSVEAGREAVRAARYLSSSSDVHIEQGLESSDPPVRLAAIESGIARAMRSAWSATKSWAGELGPEAGPLLRVVAFLGRADEHEIVYSALRQPSLQVAAIWALGHVGTTRAVEACMDAMEDERLARACGEGYCWITGADLARDRLAAPDHHADVPPFEQDDLDADLVPPLEALWPVPDSEAVRRDWAARQSAFIPDVRYIQGRRFTRDVLVAAVETGPMLRRPDLILELSARSRGGYDVEPRAFAPRQRRMMAEGRLAMAAPSGR